MKIRICFLWLIFFSLTFGSRAVSQAQVAEHQLKLTMNPRVEFNWQGSVSVQTLTLEKLNLATLPEINRLPLLNFRPPLLPRIADEFPTSFNMQSSMQSSPTKLTLPSFPTPPSPRFQFFGIPFRSNWGTSPR